MIDDRAGKGVLAAAIVAVLGVGAAASLVFLAEQTPRRGEAGQPSGGWSVEIQSAGGSVLVELQAGEPIRLHEIEISRDGRTLRECVGSECDPEERVRVGDRVSAECKASGRAEAVVEIRGEVIARKVVGCSP